MSAALPLASEHTPIGEQTLVHGVVPITPREAQLDGFNHCSNRFRVNASQFFWDVRWFRSSKQQQLDQSLCSRFPM